MDASIIILATEPTAPPWLAALGPIALFLFGVFLFVKGVKSHVNKKDLENIPTVKANAVATGIVELSGKAKPLSNDTISPIFGIPCAYCRTVLEKFYRTPHHSSWRVIKQSVMETGAKFLLEDESGAILIDSKDSEMQISSPKEQEAERQAFSGKQKDYLEKVMGSLSETDTYYSRLQTDSFRIREYIIEPGKQMYVFGTAKMPEEPLPPGLANDLVICKGGPGKLFVISDSPEKSVSRNFGVSGNSYILMGGASMMLALIAALIANQAIQSFIFLFVGISMFAALLVAPSLLKKLLEPQVEQPKDS